MKFFACFRIFLLIAATLVVAGLRSEAQTQTGLTFSITSSTNSLLVSNSVTFTIDITNITGIDLEDLVVTDSLPASVQITSANATAGEAAITNFGNSVVFFYDEFISGQISQLTVTAQPLAAGFITNTVTISSIGLTNSSTNIVVDVTNAVTLADLGVTLTGPTQPVITNDWITYGITVSNAGPDSAPNVLLTNALPVNGFLFEGIVPTNMPVSVISNTTSLFFNLGTLASGGFTNLQITVQVPTNEGALPFSASVGAPGVTDDNLTNNFAVTNITVTNYLTGILQATTNSTQVINPQDGLEEQTILLSNLGKNNVSAERLVVTGLPKKLYNAVGTNNGNPFVTVGAGLNALNSLTLLLQYNPRGSFPFTNGQLQAFAVPSPNLTPPTATSTSTNINISGIFTLPNGNMLIEFAANTNKTYTIIYSDNMQFSNAMIAPPAIAAPANIVQWIDYGPPTTLSAPTNSSVRFYRVLQNP
ncbi:MAG: hypothetical protein ABSF34_06375 [Verrucomicrobiota bacterium]|jgi:uncharacterized repeat protein (TIGR01451 family)